MFKAALKASNSRGKLGATAICNYAIFLYRNKKDPVQAAKLFCEGIEKFVKVFSFPLSFFLILTFSLGFQRTEASQRIIKP
jgi:hypothetical protein